MPDSWQDRLKAKVPQEEIPTYLAELQALVAGLREWREAQRVPQPEDVRPLLTPLLVAHGDLTAAYITDERYQEVLRQALEP